MNFVHFNVQCTHYFVEHSSSSGGYAMSSEETPISTGRIYYIFKYASLSTSTHGSAT